MTIERDTLIPDARDTLLKQPGLLLVLTGPTAAGKTEIRNRILQDDPTMIKLVSTTTRPPRQGEQDGIDYNFIGKEEFLRNANDGKFLELAEYGGNLYGTEGKESEAVLNGKKVVATLELSGALNLEANVRKHYPPEIANYILTNTIIIFIGIDSLLTLRQRYIDRGDTKESLIRRLRTDWEVWKKNQARFENIIINKNGQLNNTISQVIEVVRLKRQIGK